MRIERTRRRLRNRYLNDPNVPGITGIGRRGKNLVLNYQEDMKWRSWGWLQLTRWLAWQPIQLTKMRRPQASQDHTKDYRPAPGGVSIGHVKITAGTLGGRAKRKSDGARVVLSNNHVLANSNNADIGDIVLQRGSFDGGSSPNQDFATLLDWVPIDFAGNPNEVDAAIAQPINDTDLADSFLMSGLMPTTIIDFAVGDPAMKEGRTTAVTDGVVDQTGWEGDIGYGGGNVARYINQVIFKGTGDVECDGPAFLCMFCAILARFGFFLPWCLPPKFSDGGDSGSWIRRMPNELGALLFAGSDTMTVGNPASIVMAKLNLEL